MGVVYSGEGCCVCRRGPRGKRLLFVVRCLWQLHAARKAVSLSASPRKRGDS